MRNYTSFKYIFPPRPETVAPPAYLGKIGDRFIGQPKLNGSCAILATNGQEVHFMNRHKSEFSNKLLISREELSGLHRGNGWTYLVGEYLNKSKKDKNSKIFNGKFVIFDILVHNDQWLVGTTFSERQRLIEKLYESTDHDGWIRKISDNCFRVENFSQDLEKKWKEVVKVDMYEGMVFKKHNAKLEVSFGAKNNTGWQMKIRKPTKNYSY